MNLSALGRTASVCLVCCLFPASGDCEAPVSFISGSGIQLGVSAAADAQGNTYLLAQTDSPYIDVPGLPRTQCLRSTDIVLVSFRSGTNTPVWARCFGGDWDDRASAVAIGGDNSIYIAGSTNSPNFTGPATVLKTSGGMDGFVVKLSPDGSNAIWTTLIGGSSEDRINSLFVAASGDVYVGGETQSTDLRVLNAMQSRSGGGRDGFVCRLDGHSGSILSCTYLGGGGTDRVRAVSGDAEGNVYAAGMTDSPDFPAVAAFIAVKPGLNCGFVTKLRASGREAIYSTYLCGSGGLLEGSEHVNAIVVSAEGTAYVGGVTSSLDFPLRKPKQSVFNGWNTDAFLAGIAPDGRTLLFSTYLGGGQSDMVAALRLDETAGIITAAGTTMSMDFPNAAGASGPFVVQYSTTGQHRTTTVPLDQDLVAAGLVLTSGRIVVAGTRRASTASTPSAFLASIPNVQGQIIWTNDATRQTTIWQPGGSRGALQHDWWWVNQAGVPGWKIVAMADFNRDGSTDLVWQNDTTRQVTVWYQTSPGSSTNIGWNWISSAGAPGWRIVGAADFNRDGTPDIVWQNESTRQVTVWYMGGAQGNLNIGWDWLNLAGAPGWMVVGAADFNCDGTPDLVWLNDATRQATVWYMGGTQGSVNTGWNWLNASGAPGWKAVATADADQDGVPDLIWQNDATRQATVWYMGGAQGNVNVGWDWVNPSSAPGWTITAGR